MGTDISLITEPITREWLKTIAAQRFGDLVKAVVDVETGIMAVGGELHADEEAFLLEQGSKQTNLWGINIYPDLSNREMVEFDSVINVRPSQNNRSRSIEDEKIKAKILEVINRLVLNE